MLYNGRHRHGRDLSAPNRLDTISIISTITTVSMIATVTRIADMTDITGVCGHFCRITFIPNLCAVEAHALLCTSNVEENYSNSKIKRYHLKVFPHTDAAAVPHQARDIMGNISHKLRM